MAIEAELKARVHDVTAVREALSARAAAESAESAESAEYQDTYFDRADDGFMADGRELRLRTVKTPESVRTLLTFKAPAVDEASGSKPEFETVVGDREAAAAILTGLGYKVALEFTKQCENFEFDHDGYSMLATLVTAPEVDGTFLEVETVVAQHDGLSAALGVVRAVLHQLGIGDEDLTTELYTDAVRRARAT